MTFFRCLFFSSSTPVEQLRMIKNPNRSIREHIYGTFQWPRNAELGILSHMSWQHSIYKSEKWDGHVVSILSPYLHITKNYVTVKQATQFHSVLMKAAAVLDCELGSLQVPLTFWPEIKAKGGISGDVSSLLKLMFCHTFNIYGRRHHEGPFSRTACFSPHFAKSGASKKLRMNFSHFLGSSLTGSRPIILSKQCSSEFCIICRV